MERLLGIGRAAGAREVHAGCSMNNLQRGLFSVEAIATRDNLRCGQPLINSLPHGTIRNTSNLQCISQMGQIANGKISRGPYHAPAFPEGKD